MIALVEGAARQKTPERDRADHPARRADDHLPARRRRAAADGRLLRRAAVPDRADRAAGLPDPDHHRRAAVGDRHRRHGPARAAQRARHVRPGGRGRRRRRHPAAGQDRHDHLRQPAGHRADPGARRRSRRAGRGRPAVQPGRPDPGGPQHRRAVRRRARARRPRRRRDEAAAEFVPFTAQTRMSGLDLGRARRSARAPAPRSPRGWATGQPVRRRSQTTVDRIAERGRHAAGRRRAGRRRARRVLGVVRALRRGQARHGRAVRRAAGDGHPHGDDHRRQPAAPRRRSPRRPASTTSSPRPRPRTRWR